MDIVRFRGGLGNQMFQYAFYLELKSRNRSVKASLGFYRRHPEKRCFCLTDIFPNVALEYIPDEEFDAIDLAWKRIKEDKKQLSDFLLDYSNRFFWVEDLEFHFKPEVFETKNCTFVGFWQSEKFFYNVRDEVLKCFEFSYGEKKLNNWREILLDSDQYIAVHLRRGDYVGKAEVHGDLWDSQYYENAISYIKERVANARFIFFSDEIQWVKRRFPLKDAIFIEESMFDNYQPWYDMCLMSSCSHNIIANSTFSWWGAWLNKNESKIVVAPEKWFFDGRDEKDICPNRWIRI